MKKLLMALGALALCSTFASADIPDPSQCIVVPADNLGPAPGGMIVAPLNPSVLAATVNTITVKNSLGDVIVGANVVVLLGAANPACTAAVLTGTTNGSGVTTITLGAGGCSHQVPGSGVIKANGVTIRSYSNVKGPDFDGAGGNKAVNLSDLVDFADQFNGVSPPQCHDYDNDGDTDVGDLTIFGAAFSGANNCP